MTTAAHSRVLVVGAINHDLVLDVPTFPAPGQTVLADRFRHSGGGKGANQAVAAARCGATVALVGCVGDDLAGAELLEELARSGVDVTRVAPVEGASGTAVVTVDSHGQNTIVVAAGANLACDATWVTANLRDLTDTDLVLVQAEIPLDGLRAAVTAAAAAGATLIVNLSPALDQGVKSLDLPPGTLLVVNEHEARALAQVSEDTDAGLVPTAAALHSTLVVTRGSHGVRLVDASGVTSFAAVAPIRVVDTTGAGDAFTGAFAAALAAGHPVATAVRWGAAAGSITVASHGARSSALRETAIVAHLVP